MFRHIYLRLLFICLIFDFAYSSCFYGGTESCQFQCHCSNGEACISDGKNSGKCPDYCGNSEHFPWSGLGCQIGNVALHKYARQTGNAVRVAEYAVDGSTSGLLINENECSNPREDNQGLWWEVDLYDEYVISAVHIYASSFIPIISGIVVHILKQDRTQLYCGTTGSSENDEVTFVHCSTDIKGKYVRISYNPKILSHMYFCEVSVQGYKHVECEIYKKEYRYGPACLLFCHCQTQCDYITGKCPGMCMDGYRKDKDEICNDNCSGYWGEQCKIPCNCKSPCNVDFGVCNTECNEGFQGNNCQERICDSNYWGDHCEGIQPCNAGYWGVQCENICKCADENEICAQTTGLCSSGCHSSYMGETCHIKIAFNTDCSQNNITNSTCKDSCLSDYSHQHFEACDTCFSCTNEPILPFKLNIMSVLKVTNTSVTLRIKNEGKPKVEQYYILFNKTTDFLEVLHSKSETVLIENLSPNEYYMFSLYPVISTNYELITRLLVEQEVKTLPSNLSNTKRYNNTNKRDFNDTLMISLISLAVIIAFVIGVIVIVVLRRLKNKPSDAREQRYNNYQNDSPKTESIPDTKKRQKQRRPGLEEPDSDSSSTASESPSDTEVTYSDINEISNHEESK